MKPGDMVDVHRDEKVGPFIKEEWLTALVMHVNDTSFVVKLLKDRKMMTLPLEQGDDQHMWRKR
jgi:hypothetical protein